MCNGVRATVVGTRRAEVLTGTPARDIIDGLGGKDVIDGGAGNDVICGGSGSDVMFGGAGNDVMYGGAGNDFLAGEAGNDRLNSGPGRDTCSQNVGRGRIAGCETIVRQASTLAPGAPLRTDAVAEALVRGGGWEPRQENALANHTVPSGPVPWSMAKGQISWRRWIAKRSRVTGNFTGTTDQILQWSAYKWGLDEDLLRAVGVQESYWRQSFVGDNGASFGLMQIRNNDSKGAPAFGGYPWTQRSTALNVDFFGAWIRSCLEGDFYDGGQWLYGGTRVRGDLWGCVGAWYSGSWYDAGSMRYVAQVKAILAARPWRHWRG
jgi:hypothetical protein